MPHSATHRARPSESRNARLSVARARRPLRRGVVFRIIGVLALKLALGDAGKATNQKGALETSRRDVRQLLLVLLALGPPATRSGGSSASPR